MDFIKLLYFKTIAKTLNFTEASKELYVSQSNLSEQIKKIEEELGCSLLMRNTKKVSLTKEGEIFLSFCNETLENYEKVLGDINSLPKIVSIGLSYSKKIQKWINLIEEENKAQNKVIYKYSFLDDFIPDLFSIEKSEYDICYGFFDKTMNIVNYNFSKVEEQHTKLYSKYPVKNISDIKNGKIYYHTYCEGDLDRIVSILGKFGIDGEIIPQKSYCEIMMELERKNSFALLHDELIKNEDLYEIMPEIHAVDAGWLYKEKTPETEWVINNLK